VSNVRRLDLSWRSYGPFIFALVLFFTGVVTEYTGLMFLVLVMVLLAGRILFAVDFRQCK